jgi:uncharacterized membrane protein YkoI
LDARAINAKTLLVAAAATMLLLVGAGVAYASGSGGDSSGQATGANLDKAKSVALDHVNGPVTGTEVGDEEGAYQIEVTRDDGSHVDVNLDKNFSVLGTPADNEGPDGQDASNDGGD